MGTPSIARVTPSGEDRHEITETPPHCWQRVYGGMRTGEAKRLRRLEEEQRRRRCTSPSSQIAGKTETDAFRLLIGAD